MSKRTKIAAIFTTLLSKAINAIVYASIQVRLWTHWRCIDGHMAFRAKTIPAAVGPGGPDSSSEPGTAWLRRGAKTAGGHPLD
jgi:hypothetical protein